MKFKPLGHYLSIELDELSDKVNGVILPPEEINKIRTGTILSLPEQNPGNDHLFKDGKFMSISVGDKVLVARNAGFTLDGKVSFIKYNEAITQIIFEEENE